MLDFELDLSGVKAAGPSIVDKGTYQVISDEAELKDTKSGGGQYINVKFKILGPSFIGSYIFMMFNIKNENQKAVEIGLGQLKAFMNAAGINAEKLKSPVELVGYKVMAVVKHREDSYGTKAVISYFKPFENTDLTSGTKENDVPFI